MADNTPAADQAWQVILEQAGGPGTRFHDQKEAIAAARQHLDKQEANLRQFMVRYSQDSRRYSVRVRLSGVLHAKAKFGGNTALREESAKLLADIENNPENPPPVRADAAFARISQTMEDMAGRLDVSSRESLGSEVQRFRETYPDDRRTSGLLAELATLYDNDPDHKRSLLNQALVRASDPSLRLRIEDDLKRIDLLGKVLDFRLQPVSGGPAIDLASRRGRVVVLLFWASWSGPSLRELAGLMKLAETYSGRPVDFLSISLDEDRTALLAMIKAAGLQWPVHCDGSGWKGEVIKATGVNALPTVFILDRHGVLTTLNARGSEQADISTALSH